MLTDAYGDLDDWGWTTLKNVSVKNNGKTVIIHQPPTALFYEDGIDALDIRDEVVTVLLRNGIKRISDLQEQRVCGGILKIDGIGRTYEAEIVNALDKYKAKGRK